MVLACGSSLRALVLGVGSFSTILAREMSSLPGGCLLVVSVGVPGAAGTSADSFKAVFEAPSSALAFSAFSGLSAFVAFSGFLFAALFFAVAFEGVSGVGFSSFTSSFFAVASPPVLLLASDAAGDLVAVAFVDALVGVAGAVLELAADVGSAASAALAACLPFLPLAGVSGLTGATGTTGTAGTMVEEVVLDIGREPGRDPGRDAVSSARALGIAGAVKPGGIEGVDRRGCSKKCPLSGVANG